jgi:hypothetical protein
VPILGRLRPPQHQIANFECSSLDLPLVVPAKGLLVAGRANQGHLPCHVLLSFHGSIGVKGFDPWGAIV